MFQLLLILIYLSFISLGLPDSLLGSAWPTMYPQLGVPVSYAGIISMIIALGTIVSSLQSDRLTRRLGTGKVTAISVAMTAVALWGFSVSSAHRQSCQNSVQVEKPSSATAVVATLSAVTRPVPRRVLSRSLARLDTMVPAEMIIDTPPAHDTPAPSWGYILGHAAPSSASGRPRLMNAR